MATVNISAMAKTWNDAGTTFTAIGLDVTDTASADASLLLDLLVGGTSRYNVSKRGDLSVAPVWNDAVTAFKAIDVNLTDTASDGASDLLSLRLGGVAQFKFGKGQTGDYGLVIGDGTPSGGASWPYLTFDTTWGDVKFLMWGGNVRLDGALTSFTVSGNVAATLGHYIGITSASGVVNASVFSDAANYLDQRNGTAAQSYRLANTYTDGSNYEHGGMRWTGNVMEVFTAAAGTGTRQDVQLNGANRASKISDPSGGATQDAEARTAINAIIDALESHGLAATV